MWRAAERHIALLRFRGVRDSVNVLTIRGASHIQHRRETYNASIGDTLQMVVPPYQSFQVPET
jgi:hypothetical protein